MSCIPEQIEQYFDDLTAMCDSASLTVSKRAKPWKSYTMSYCNKNVDASS